MRNILNISMPENMARQIEEETKKGNFASKSEFIRAIFRAWEEGKLYKELQQSRREIKAGKGIVLKSLKDLR
ncbi:MAG: ribbon-helix-helix domain-containing protein [Patescibacteria group bacterium]